MSPIRTTEQRAETCFDGSPNSNIEQSSSIIIYRRPIRTTQQRADTYFDGSANSNTEQSSSSGIPGRNEFVYGNLIKISPTLISNKPVSFKHTLNFTLLAINWFNQVKDFSEITVGEIMVESPYSMKLAARADIAAPLSYHIISYHNIEHNSIIIVISLSVHVYIYIYIYMYTYT